MKILLFTTYYDVSIRPDLRHDTSAIHYLTKYWAKDHEVLVINTYIHKRSHIARYLDPKNAMQFFQDYSYEIDGVKVYIVENQVTTGRYFHAWNWRKLAGRSRKILEQENFVPDVVLSHFPSYSYGFLGRLGLTCPKIAILHQTDLYHARRRKQFRLGLDSQFDAVFSRSAKIRDAVRELGVKNVRDEIIYSGTPVARNAAPRDFVKHERIQILYAGKLIPLKHVEWVIRSLAKQGLEELELSIVGEGPREQALKKLTKKLCLEDRVHFLGKVSREEVQEKMQKADIFCMPSYPETFGLVYVEAMSCGCVTIGTRGEGIDGVIVDGENGFLIRTEEELQDCLRRILHEVSEEKLTEISRRAVETGARLSEQNCSAQYLEAVQRILWEKNTDN